MKSQKVMGDFLNSLQRNKKLTIFFKYIFEYKILNDYNYISRIVIRKDNIIIDIYDNLLNNRFNRYIFDFKNNNYDINIKSDDDVTVTSICMNGKITPTNNLMKLAYIFSNGDVVISYAQKFLPQEIYNILEKVIIKK